MRVVFIVLAVLAAVVGLQLVGVAFFALPSIAAQRVFEAVTRCCGDDLGVISSLVVFLGGIGLMWWALASWRTRRWRKRLIRSLRADS